MILANLPRVPAPPDDIIPEFIPERQRREARAREVGQGGEVEPVQGTVGCIDDECQGDGEDEEGEGDGG